MTVTRFTSCCQTKDRGLGSDLRVTLVLLGTKTNFSILPRERSSPGTDHAAKREEHVEKPEFRREEAQLHEEINLVSSGGERSRHGQAREPGGFPVEPSGAQARVPVTREIMSSGKHSLKQRGSACVCILSLLHTPELPKV